MSIWNLAPSMTTTTILLYYTGLSLLGMALIIPILVIVVTVLLTAITSLRWRSSKDNHQDKIYESSFCTGRVVHMRYQPAIHGFSYPMFFSFMNVQEIPLLFGDSLHKGKMWPLSMLVSFQVQDHLKNGEGLLPNDNNTRQLPPQSLEDRVFRFIAQRTNDKFKPTADTHSIQLLTHLSYFGYCFNPVSFYYILNKEQSRTIDAIIAEVSNTPWNEMYCYVLHPDSVDMTSVSRNGNTTTTLSSDDNKHNTRPTVEGSTTTKPTTSSSSSSSWNYKFPKKFHVSPFMEMELEYDWTFQEVINDNQNKIQVSTTLLRQDNGTTQFNANFQVTPLDQPIHPWQICRLLLTYPIYCAVVQIWIHYEAFWLFVKGVVFIDHPEGAETAASRMIGSIMTPLFSLKDWMDETFSSNSSNNKTKEIIANHDENDDKKTN